MRRQRLAPSTPKVLKDRHHVAVLGIRGQGRGDVLYPHGANSKIGRPVMEVQQEKNPAPQVPDPEDSTLHPCSRNKRGRRRAVLIDMPEEDVAWGGR